MMVDIENPISLRAYLKNRGVLEANESLAMELLKGGVSNKTIVLKRENKDDWVIKQGLKKLRVEKEWLCDPRRLKVEYLAMKWLSNVLKEGVIPKPLLWDEINFILGMEAVPKPHENLKSLLLNGEFELELLSQMGSNLATIHIAGRNSNTAKSIFENRSFFKALRIEAYYLSAANEFKKASRFFNQLVQESMAIRETVVHGDYSPKNMLVTKGKLVLLDHEVTHFGDPAFDVGFALCHLLSKANHLPQHRSKMIQAAHTFWNSYTNSAEIKNLTDFEILSVKHTIGCLIARIKGKSPLAYLDKNQQRKQLSSAWHLAMVDIKKIPELITLFLNELERNDN